MVEGGEAWRNKFPTYKGTKDYEPGKYDAENFWEDPEFDWIKPRPVIRQFILA